MSGIVAGVEMSQNNRDYGNGTNQQRMSDALSESLGQNFGGLLEKLFERNLNISPTIEIRNGFPFVVMVTKDVVFSGPYQHMDWKRRMALARRLKTWSGVVVSP